MYITTPESGHLTNKGASAQLLEHSGWDSTQCVHVYTCYMYVYVVCIRHTQPCLVVTDVQLIQYSEAVVFPIIATYM